MSRDVLLLLCDTPVAHIQSHDLPVLSPQQQIAITDWSKFSRIFRVTVISKSEKKKQSPVLEKKKKRMDNGWDSGTHRALVFCLHSLCSLAADACTPGH